MARPAVVRGRCRAPTAAVAGQRAPRPRSNQYLDKPRPEGKRALSHKAARDFDIVSNRCAARRLCVGRQGVLT